MFTGWCAGFDAMISPRRGHGLRQARRFNLFFHLGISVHTEKELLEDSLYREFMRPEKGAREHLLEPRPFEEGEVVRVPYYVDKALAERTAFLGQGSPRSPFEGLSTRRAELHFLLQGLLTIPAEVGVVLSRRSPPVSSRLARLGFLLQSVVLLLLQFLAFLLLPVLLLLVPLEDVDNESILVPHLSERRAVLVGNSVVWGRIALSEVLVVVTLGMAILLTIRADPKARVNVDLRPGLAFLGRLGRRLTHLGRDGRVLLFSFFSSRVLSSLFSSLFYHGGESNIQR